MIDEAGGPNVTIARLIGQRFLAADVPWEHPLQIPGQPFAIDNRARYRPAGRADCIGATILISIGIERVCLRWCDRKDRQGQCSTRT
jgi:hypothetical protein